jgi:hypothetical protein
MSSNHPPANYRVTGSKESMDAVGTLSHSALVARAETASAVTANRIYTARCQPQDVRPLTRHRRGSGIMSRLVLDAHKRARAVTPALPEEPVFRE